MLLSMGTGVTPMLQILNEAWKEVWGRGRTAHIHLYHCSRTADTVLCGHQLAELEAVSCKQLRVHHTYSEQGRLTPERLRASLLEQELPPERCTFVLCGTDSFALRFRNAFNAQSAAVYVL